MLLIAFGFECTTVFSPHHPHQISGPFDSDIDAARMYETISLQMLITGRGAKWNVPFEFFVLRSADVKSDGFNPVPSLMFFVAKLT